jgi:hypothetical protein
MPLTLGGFCGIWVVVDLILIACGSFRDQQDRPLFKWFEEGSV